MNKLEFLNKLQEEMKKNYPEVKNVIIDDNNTENIIIELADDDMIKIDTDEIYELYKDGIYESWSHLCFMVKLKIIRHNIKKNAPFHKAIVNEILSNKEKFLNNVVFVCAEAKEDGENLYNCPNIRKYGLTFFYGINVDPSNNMEDITVFADKKVINKLGITEEELYNRAYSNTKNMYKLGIKFIGMTEIESGGVMEKISDNPEYIEISKKYNLFNVPFGLLIHTQRCKNVESLLMSVDNFDRIGAFLKENYYLVINSAVGMTAYPESAVNYSDIEKIRDTLYQDVVFYYKNGEVMIR